MALERDAPAEHAALLLAVVGGYYTDKDVRDRLGYPGQVAKQIYSWQYPTYLAEGLTDQVVARGPIWRDPATGRRAELTLTTRRAPSRRTPRWPHSASTTGSIRSSRTGDPGTGDALEDREPATGIHLLTIPGSTPDDVARAAAAASAAQPAWAETSYQERARILRRAADIYEAHRDEFGSWTQRETGAVHSKMHHEQNFAYQELLNAATMPSQPYGSLMPTAQKGRLSMVRRVPVGVVGAITPWNSPTVLGMRVVAPALALGNAVVLKPDPQTPVAGGAMFAAVFAEAGLPDGLLQIVVGGADVGEALVTDPAHLARVVHRVDGRGRRVGQLAGGLLKKVSLELGGNNAFVVLDDADLDAAAVGRGVRVVPVPGPGLLRGRPPPRPPQRRRRVRRRPHREGEAAPARRSVSRGRPARADRQREAARPGRRDRPALDRRRGAAGRGWRPTRACSTARPSSPRSRPTCRR